MKKIIKEERWVTLPTENYSGIVHSTSKYGGLFLSRHYSPMKEMGDRYQHLYLTSDEEIKEGDFYITDAGVFESNGCESKRELSNFKKIIATTDILPLNPESLFIMPRIPESFINHYVMKQGEVGDVEVELEKDNYWFNAKVIIPKEEKKFYSRDELHSLLNKMNSHAHHRKSTVIELYDLDKWVKENL